jgi:glutamyl-tRNA synthetase
MQFQAIKVDTSNGPELVPVVNALRERSKTLVEMAEKAACFYQATVTYDEKAAAKFLTEAIVPAFECLKEQLSALVDWNEEAIGNAFTLTLEKFGLKMPKLAQPLRVALVGSTQSPGISTTLHLLGQEKAVTNIRLAIEYLANR